MREADFRAWLDQRLWKGQPLTKKARDNRVRRTLRAERGLKGLGFAYDSLDALNDDGHWQALLDRLGQLRNDPDADQAAVRSVVPEADDPTGQLNNMIAALRLYRHFLDGRDPNYDAVDLVDEADTDLHLSKEAVEEAMQAYDGDPAAWMAKYAFSTNYDYVVSRPNSAGEYPAKAIFCVAYSSIPGNSDITGLGERNTYSDATGGPIHTEFVRLGYRVYNRRQSAANGSQAEAIRQYVIANHIEPARQRGDASVTIRAGDVHSALGLSNQMPIVCAAIESRLLQGAAGLSAPAVVSGPSSGRGANMVYRFELQLGASVVKVSSSTPTNLILYGPPGTGKTYRTALEAVKLCDPSANHANTPEGRAALMKHYGELVNEKRIAFVTFHQNYDYETFVEGLRPDTGSEAGENTTGGFRLVPTPGIFREICALAEQARTRPASQSGTAPIDFSGRRFWKMGLGAIGSEDDVYEAAIANHYVALGWGGAIDWSGSQFTSFEAIKAEWLARNPDDRTPSNWTQTWPFRCEMKVGDIIIVPFGNTAFRAIAEVTGDYQFEPTVDGYYAHRREVHWLLTLDDPLPLDTIVDGNFTMRTLYALADKRVNKPALARLLGGDDRVEQPQPAGPDVTGGNVVDQFVLIIDEINRANVSKVFGEMITLIEPDKRLGQANPLTLTLPYSKRRDFGVPENLHIIGTMNTADRSIALLDTALRRRFQFCEMAPEPGLLATASQRTGIDLVAVLTTINQRIEYLFDREHRIGHAFFINCQTAVDVEAAMRDKVIPLLQEYFFEDWGRIHAVLGDGFIAKTALPAPPGYDEGERTSWSVRNPFRPNAYAVLLGKATAVADGDAEEVAIVSDGTDEEA